ncbi:hypothetical protein HPB48_010086 [Haemaphysalis longicornis]|uniref:Uncharacterized protein n=1 Tax=Haemaphysalis longicornis TaxID=44386 RepID=A0A9J6FY89_HAELO|nr:hypothetical protein HPB48_010086 [Haemaphysalis longicornis]
MFCKTYAEYSLSPLLQVLFDVFEKFNFTWPSLSLPGNFDVMEFLLGLPLDYGLSTPFALTLTPYLKTDRRYSLAFSFEGPTHQDEFEASTLQRCIPVAASSASTQTALTVAERIESVWVNILIHAFFLRETLSQRSFRSIEALANDTNGRASLDDWLRAINKHLPQDRNIDKDELVFTTNGTARLLRGLLRSNNRTRHVDVVLFGGWNIILQVHAGTSRPLMDCLSLSGRIRSAHHCRELMEKVCIVFIYFLLPVQFQHLSDYYSMSGYTGYTDIQHATQTASQGTRQRVGF